MKNTRRHHAFTLIELLVVIAIIALLASLAVPAIMAGMAHSYMVDCASNLNQIGRGLTSYATSMNSLLPNPDSIPPSSTYNGSAVSLINTLSDQIDTNTFSVWYCKRQIKSSGMAMMGGNNSAQAKYNAGQISYFYWAWSPVNTNGVDLFTTNTAFSTYWPLAKKPKAAVLMTDPFYNSTMPVGPFGGGAVTADMQYHVGVSVQQSLALPGTLMLTVGGAVQQCGPQQ